MKKIGIFTIITLFCYLLLFSCDNGSSSSSSSTDTNDYGTISSHGVTTYSSSATASPSCVIAADKYENFSPDLTVYVAFSGTGATATIGSTEYIADAGGTDYYDSASKTMTFKTVTNVADTIANGIEIQYKGSLAIRYILSGSLTGSLVIKNKNADCAVVLNGLTVTSDSGYGPALRFSSENRTFIVVPSGKTNTLTDTRVLGQANTMYDDKKGSVYSKGPLIFTGTSSTSTGGTLNVINKGYKHAIYSHDYVRVAELTLNSTVQGTTGRDCIRALNAVIIDGGTINLTGNGTVEDDESVGIKVEGEDADEDTSEVEYTCGAGFVIINDGDLTINTVAKGITAHWKSSETYIGTYTETVDSSLLASTFLSGTGYTVPNPYVEINGGTINITTTGEAYENASTSCSPEGIEAKADLTINAGIINLVCTDDAINAGGNIYINDGAVYAYSSGNDAIDSNGSGGINIAGGVVVAIGITTPECAFDCDNYPLAITGGILVGLGTNNYSAPKASACSQSVGVLSNSYYGSSNTTMAIVDSSNNAVFAYTLPSSVGTIMILSSPNIATGTTYTIKKGVTPSGGVLFHNLYTTMPTVSGGTSTSTSFKTTTSSYVYTASAAGSNGGAQEGGRPSRPGGH
ncbi:MAG: carbohydrate-binding domain-containing protein [Spirochaetia bacterium]|nr:carbohydrate-binding domain-containing protein [Spirochaetia bacterium]